MYNKLVPSYQKYSEPQLHVQTEPEWDNSEYGDSYQDELEYLHGHELSEPEDCVHVLIEELYESANVIDEKRIDAAMYALAKWSGIDSKRLDGGLNVKHGSGRRELIEWHAGYTRALIDTTHNKTLGA